MNMGIKRVLVLLVFLASCGIASAQNPGKGPDKDPFQGKLFAPDVILANREALDLSDEQLAGIRAAVIDVQSNIAEYQWDLRDAYQLVLADLDESPVDEQKVLEHVQAAMAAENQVKTMQVGMLVKIRNLLTDGQVSYLKALNKP